MNLLQTTIPNDFTIAMRSKTYKWTMSNTPFVYNSIFSGIAHYLSANKSKNETVGIKFVDSKGEFLFGVSVSYQENETDPEMPGNWELSGTFYPEEFKVDNEALSTDMKFVSVVINRAERLHGMFFKAEAYIYEILILSFKVLRQALEVNAKDGETYEVEIPSYAKLNASVEGEKVLLGVEFDETLVQIVKDDSAEL